MLVVTPVGERPMAAVCGGRASLGAADGCAGEVPGVPLWAPREQAAAPHNPVKPVATISEPQSRDR